MNEDIVEKLRNQRDEDGYCVVCGDGKWKSHFPKCTLCDAADEIFELRNRIAQLEQALDSLGYLRAITAIMEEPK